MRTILLLLLLAPCFAAISLETKRRQGGGGVGGDRRRSASAARWKKWGAANEELEKRLEVAICRAGCKPSAILDSTSIDTTSTILDPTSLDTTSTILDPTSMDTSCWSNCEHLQGLGSRPWLSNRPARERAGRRLKTRLTFPTRPVLVFDSTSGCRLTWSDLTAKPNYFSASTHLDKSTVFLLLGKEDESLPWRELGQTSRLSLPIPSFSSHLSLLLLAVGKRGIKSEVAMEVKPGQCGQYTGNSAPELLQATKVAAHLVRAEIRWLGSEGASYLVKWEEVPSSLVVGSLVTLEEKANITLQQDAVYSVVVEMISSQGTVVRSPSTIIDTKNLNYSKDYVLESNPVIPSVDKLEEKSIFSARNCALITIIALLAFLMSLMALTTSLRPHNSPQWIGRSSHTHDEQPGPIGRPTDEPSGGLPDGSNGGQTDGPNGGPINNQLPESKVTNPAGFGFERIKVVLAFFFKKSDAKNAFDA